MLSGLERLREIEKCLLSDKECLPTVEEVKTELHGPQLKVFEAIVKENSEGRAPSYRMLDKVVYPYNYSYEVCKSLEQNGVVTNVSVVEVYLLYNIEKRKRCILPPEVKNKFIEISEIHGGMKGGHKSWMEKFNNPRAKHYMRFVLALAMLEDEPVYRRVLDNEILKRLSLEKAKSIY